MFGVGTEIEFWCQDGESPEKMLSDEKILKNIFSE